VENFGSRGGTGGRPALADVAGVGVGEREDDGIDGGVGGR